MSDELPPEKPLTGAQRDEAAARQDLSDILILKRTLSFQRYFMRRLREKLEPLEQSILNDELDIDDHRRKQARLGMLREVIRMLDQDEAGNRSITGLTGGDPLPDGKPGKPQ